MSGKPRIQIKVTRKSETHAFIKITTRAGYVYASSWACDEGEEPTEAEIIESWVTDRKSYQAYDESTGYYIKK